jgi:hypothetical protein
MAALFEIKRVAAHGAKFPLRLWIIVDSFFPPEKILESFREILTTSFKYSNHRRSRGGNSIARFFLP